MNETDRGEAISGGGKQRGITASNRVQKGVDETRERQNKIRNW